jgi:hypothetical protein
MVEQSPHNISVDDPLYKAETAKVRETKNALMRPIVRR